jgi:hypothetical protein
MSARGRWIAVCLLLIVAGIASLRPEPLGRSALAALHAAPATDNEIANLFPTEAPAEAPPEPSQPEPSPPTPLPEAARAQPVQAENQREGTTAWRVTNAASAGEIQAYADQASVNAGGAISFYVSTRQPGTAYRIDFYRMGWYGGAGARLAGSATRLRGNAQGYSVGGGSPVGCATCRLDAGTGLLDAGWSPSYRLDVPDTWLSGAYLALLTDARGKQTYVPFVVRQDGRASDLLLKLSVNTYQAYNAWGGKGLYAYNSRGARTASGNTAAVKVSFNRPYDTDSGSGQFLRYEYNLVRWVERMGYDVSYVTDTDVSANGSLLLQHRGFVSAGHDEYWTSDERENVEQALRRGVQLAFLSGDAVYWQARYEAAASGNDRRTLVVYRGSGDPLYASDPAHATVRWQDAPINRPENLLTGTNYAGQTEPFTQDWVVQDTDSWVFAGTGLHPGDHVPKLVGKEFDRAGDGLPSSADLQILSHSPITVPAVDRPPNVAFAETTIYTAPSGATVFSAGDVTWSWGLDDAAFVMAAQHNTPVSPAIQRLTQNLLDVIAYGAPSAP